ncbi:MerR family transcriptional regulator [Scatolibacter rhodanostii]|uniref:MerR family transcriptional regulator n=1 Tax=Scatolibacter rhodanostii TaxID=2014781 RepID=UPI000C0827DC|nr:MerR family transcriptional regulator [Scatolibacter rhodanostii]
MNTKEVAAISGVSVRTLHHYDEIGLLCPQRNPQNDYREYREEDIDALQQILFFKECGFSLTQIKALLQQPDFNQEKAFELQKKFLLHEKKRIDQMLKTLNKTMQAQKGEIVMSQKEKFDGFDFTQNPYEEEAKNLWGKQAVQHVNELPTEGKMDLGEDMQNLFIELAQITAEPDSEETQQAMKKMFAFFNSRFGYQYTPQAFAGVGQLYITDERFQKNIDQFREGLSAFLAESMKIFAENHKA